MPQPIELLAALARDAGAHVIAREASATRAMSSTEARRLSMRLRVHLRDRWHSLTLSDAELTSRLDALRACLALAGQLVEARADHPDPIREELARSLEVERTKFLARVDADAIGELCDWLLGFVQVSNDALRAQVLVDARRLFGPVYEWIPTLALTTLPTAPQAIDPTQLVDGSRGVVAKCLEAYDHTALDLEWALIGTLDQLVDSARAAAIRKRELQTTDAVEDERARIHIFLVRLAELSE